MMIAIDTNILVRFLTRDHIHQYRTARALMETERIFIPESVLLETEWVLRGIYKLTTPEIRRALQGIFGLKNVTLAYPEKIARVLEWHESGMDFADALHLANSRHLPVMKTFDKNFIKRAKGLTTCKVSEA